MIASSDAEALGHRALNELQEFKRSSIEVIEDLPELQKDLYIPASNVWTRPQEISPITLGQVVWFSTSQSLAALNYDGARSNSGMTIIPLFAAGFRKLEQVEKIFKEVGPMWHIKSRCLLKDGHVIRTFQNIMDDLFLKVLNEVIAQNLQELPTYPGLHWARENL
jgi:hypothetical protein